MINYLGRMIWHFSPRHKNDKLRKALKTIMLQQKETMTELEEEKKQSEMRQMEILNKLTSQEQTRRQES